MERGRLLVTTKRAASAGVCLQLELIAQISEELWIRTLTNAILMVAMCLLRSPPTPALGELQESSKTPYGRFHYVQ